MARSVSTPSDCTAVCYQNVNEMEEHDWEYFIENIQEMSKEKWKSFEDADRWVDREDHVILESDMAIIGVSEYCGLAAIWLKSKHDDLEGSYYPEEAQRAPLAKKWAELISNNFDNMFSEYRKVATFSNGEAMFEKIN